MNNNQPVQKPNKLDVVAGLLVGIGMAYGFIPLVIASFIIKENLFLVIINQMNFYWESRGWT